MERLPPEILEQVYYEMDMDWETYRKTCIILGGVSRTIRASTTHIRWRNVSIVGSKQLFGFATLLEGTPDQLLVQNLFIGDTQEIPRSQKDSGLSSRFSSSDTASLQVNKTRRWMKFLGLKSRMTMPNKRDFNSFAADGELKTVTYILAAVSVTLRFLAIDMASVSLAILRSVTLPHLEAVSYHIGELSSAFLNNGPHSTPETPTIRDQVPNLNRLHIVSTLTDFIDNLCRVLIGQLPGLAKLRISTEFSSAIVGGNSGALSRIIDHIRPEVIQIAIYDSGWNSLSDGTRSKELRGDHKHVQVWYMPGPSFTYRRSFGDSTAHMYTLEGVRYLVFEDYRTKVGGKTWLRREQDLGINVDRLSMPFLGDEL